MKLFTRNRLNKLFNIKYISFLLVIGLFITVSKVIAGYAAITPLPSDDMVIYVDKDGKEYTFGDAYVWSDISKNGTYDAIACLYDLNDDHDLLLAFYGTGEICDMTSGHAATLDDVNNFKTNKVTPWHLLSSDIKYVGISYFEPEGSLKGFFESLSNILEYDLRGLKGNKITDMSNMFQGASCFSSGPQENPDIDVTFPDGFNAVNCSSCSNMFNSFGNYSNNLNIYLGNSFNVPKADTSFMFQMCGNCVRDKLNIDLGDNFNAKDDHDGYRSKSSMFINVGFTPDYAYVSSHMGNYDYDKIFRNISINLGKNFNAENTREMGSMFEGVGGPYSGESFTESIIIDLGDNFNAKSCVGMSYLFKRIGGASQSKNFDTTLIKIDLGDNFNPCNAETMSEMFASSFNKTKNVVIDFGKKFDTPKLTNVSYMFESTTTSGNLDINFPSGFDLSKVTAFYHFINDITSCGDINITFNGPCDLRSSSMGQELFIRKLKTTNKNGKINITFKDKVYAKNSNYLFYRLFAQTNNNNIPYKTKLKFEDDIVLEDATSLEDLFNLNSSYYPIDTNLFDKLNIGSSIITTISGMCDQSNISYMDLSKLDLSNLTSNVMCIANTTVNKIKLPNELPILNIKISDLEDTWYGVIVDTEGNETIDYDNPITDGYLIDKTSGYTYIVRSNLDLSGADASITPSSIDIGSDTNRAVTVKYKKYKLVPNTDYELNNLIPNKLGSDNTNVSAKGKGAYINETEEVSFNITSHDIIPLELELENTNGVKVTNTKPLTKEKDNTSLSPSFNLVYTNPYNGDKVYFKYDKAVILDDYFNEVKDSSNNLRNIKITNVSIDTDKTDASILSSYDTDTDNYDYDSLFFAQKVKIIEKQNSGGGSKKKKTEPKEEPKVEEPKVEEPKKESRIIMEGYSDHSFKPNNNLTRAEFAAIIARLDPLFNETENYSSYLKEFSDYKTPNNWADNYLGYLVKQKIYAGYGNGLIKPNDPISRGEVSKVLVLFEKYAYEECINTFIDSKDKWYDKYVTSLYNKRIIDGIGNNLFGGDKNITRAEIAKMITNAENIDTANISEIVNEKNYNDIFNKDWYYSYVYGVSKEYILN